jgi:hypothetical protein
VSAGLAVPEGRFEIRGLEPSANRHGSNCLITSHDLQLLFADGKWRLIVRPIHKAIVRPIHKAIIRRQMLGLPTCPDLRPIMQQASSEVVRVAPSQKPKGHEYRIFGCRHARAARANQTNDLYACVLQQGKSRSVPDINALEEAWK